MEHIGYHRARVSVTAAHFSMADTDSLASSLFPVPKSHLFDGMYDANFWEYKLSDVFHRVKDLGDSIREDDSLM